MYFIPRNNKIYSVLVTVPWYWLCALTAGALGLVLFLWWSFLYAPVSNRIISMQLDYAHMTHQQSSCTHLHEDIQRLEQAVEELGFTVTRGLQDRAAYGEMLHELLAKSTEMGLSLVSCVPGPLKNKGWYTIHPIDLQLVGTFDQLQRFLKTVALNDYPMRIKHIALQKKGQSTLLIRCVIYLLGTNDSQTIS